MLFKKEDHLSMSKRKELPRLSREHRIQHFCVFTSVLLLAFTGFPIKFHDAPWAIHVNQLLGGMEVTRIIHRICGVVFFGTIVVHIILLVKKSYCRMKEGKSLNLSFFYMLPDLKDLNDLIGDVKYWFFLSEDKPPKRRFDYAGKFEYLAIYWGGPLVFFTGIFLWFKEFFYEISYPIIGYLPGWLLNVARIAHGAEALLAVIVVIVAHWYIVHWGADTFPARWTWLNGTMPAELMEEEHLLEYERILDGDINEKGTAGISKEGEHE